MQQPLGAIVWDCDYANFHHDCPCFQLYYAKFTLTCAFLAWLCIKTALLLRSLCWATFEGNAWTFISQYQDARGYIRQGTGKSKFPLIGHDPKKMEKKFSPFLNKLSSYSCTSFFFCISRSANTLLSSSSKNCTKSPIRSIAFQLKWCSMPSTSL